PVGASSVHLVCGFWGLVATGLMATDDGLLAGGGADLLVTQVTGGLAIAAFVALASGALFTALKAVGLLRVSAEDELIGLDLTEHGAPGYGPELLTASPTTTSSASELAMS